MPLGLPAPQSPSPQAWGTIGSLASSTSTTCTTGSAAPQDDITATVPEVGAHQNLSPVSEEDPSLPASLREALAEQAVEQRAGSDPVVKLAGAVGDGEAAELERAALGMSTGSARATPRPGQEVFQPLGPTRAELLRVSYWVGFAA